ncbi:FMN reductase [Bacillus sp. SA1-12]|uniref:NADPH-dependent FMN reductase n=1 Tax=Bacillus sp. SA1-12 TaxID=1455638 RepID=UPI0006272494|nr:NADPH-dependent FMN reductase [Bacillus sp. SA1-12]KKI90337.1 FMN reductase [Bacillus sp. SA1-12]
MAKVSIITGSPNDYSRLNGILNFAITALEKEKISFDIIKVHTLPAVDLITAKFDSDAIIHANKKVENSEGVIILTPVYKASYSGILKTYLDLLPQKGLENKIVLPLVLGGSFGHLLTIEYALNPILSTLGANHIVNGVYTIDHQIERVDKNQFSLHEEALQRLNKGLDSFINTIKKYEVVL